MSDAAELPLIGAAALRARTAARVLRTLPTDAKDAALTAMADALVERTEDVLPHHGPALAAAVFLAAGDQPERCRRSVRNGWAAAWPPRAASPSP